MSISINEHILAKRRWFFQCVFILVLAIVLVGVGGEQQKVFAQNPDDEKTQDAAKRVAEAEALRIDQMNAPTAASIAAKAEAVRIAAEKSAAESEALRIDQMNAPTAASTAAKAEAVRIAEEKSVAEAYGAQLWQGAAIRLPSITHRSVYDEAGNLTQIEGFSRDEDGNVTFDSTKFIKSEGDDADDDGSDAAAEAESIRRATPVGLNIIVLRGQEPNVTINGNPVGTEGAATHGVGLDGFLLGFLANND